MALENYQQKDSVIIVYTGDGKGKTSASLGLMARGLGFNWRVAYIQFVKYWHVSEHEFILKIQELYKDDLLFYKGGKGFYQAGELSAKNVSESEHKQAAKETYDKAYDCATSGDYDLVVCDEINNAVHDGLLSNELLYNLLYNKHKDTSLCLTGRNFPKSLLKRVDIATDMTKIKHHFDDKFLANKGIDY